MAEPNFIPQPFQAQQPAIASYDYQDISSGLGFQDLYLLASVSSTGTTYILSDKQEHSGLNEISVVNTTTKFNFDSSIFNKPKTVKGTAQMTFCMRTTGSPGDGTASIQLHKVDSNNVETNISSEALTAVLSGNGVNKIFNLQLPLQQTYFGEGDKIRLSVSLAYTTSIGHLAFGISPLDYDGATILPSSQTNATTIAKLSLPSRIED